MTANSDESEFDLVGGVDLRREPRPKPPRPPRPPPGPDDWRIVDHVCVACLGRLVTRLDDAGVRLYRCTNCGSVGIGKTNGHPANCACGRKIGTRDAGIRCTRNPHPRLDMLAEIIAKEF